MTARGIQNRNPGNIEFNTGAFAHYICEKLGVRPDEPVGLVSNPKLLAGLVKLIIQDKIAEQPYDDVTIRADVDMALS